VSLFVINIIFLIRAIAIHIVIKDMVVDIDAIRIFHFDQLLIVLISCIAAVAGGAAYRRYCHEKRRKAGSPLPTVESTDHIVEL
jgi:hypothetical protein